MIIHTLNLGHLIVIMNSLMSHILKFKLEFNAKSDCKLILKCVWPADMNP